MFVSLRKYTYIFPLLVVENSKLVGGNSSHGSFAYKLAVFSDFVVAVAGKGLKKSSS